MDKDSKTSELSGNRSQYNLIDINENTTFIPMDNVTGEKGINGMDSLNTYGYDQRTITEEIVQNNENNLLTLQRAKKLRCFLSISLIVNATLMTFICLFLLRGYIVKRNSDTLLSPLCVLTVEKKPVCSDHSTSLHYIMLLAKQLRNTNPKPPTLHSTISFNDNKAKFSKISHPIGNTPIWNKQKMGQTLARKLPIVLKDNSVEIRESGMYFISVQLIFKREARLDHTTDTPIEVFCIKNKVTNTKGDYLFRRILPALNGNQILQESSITDIIMLHESDSISISTSQPHLFYVCPSCNTINVIKI